MKHPRIQGIHLDAQHVHMTLSDGRCLRQSLKRHPRLAEADERQRAAWVLRMDGTAAHWPSLGSDGVTVEVFDWVWEEICEAAMDQLKVQDWKMDVLPLRTQRIVALWRLEADGYNGGFLQFFCNWGEANCRVALDALQEIGARATHDVVFRQKRMLDRLEDHPGLKSYDDIYRLLTPDEFGEIGDVLDHALCDAAMEIPRKAVLRYDAGPPMRERSKG